MSRRVLQEKTFSIAKYGKRRLADMRARYERTGWAVTVDDDAKTMTVRWSGKPRRHAKGG